MAKDGETDPVEDVVAIRVASDVVSICVADGELTLELWWVIGEHEQSSLANASLENPDLLVEDGDDLWVEIVHHGLLHVVGVGLADGVDESLTEDDLRFDAEGEGKPWSWIAGDGAVEKLAFGLEVCFNRLRDGIDLRVMLAASR